MITSTKNLEKYCKDYQNIQNYEDAVKSPLRYDLHHRREISENKSRKQLIAENLYYGRPPEELIFLEHSEHVRLHKANLSAETRQKISEANRGKHLSKETRQRMSNAKKNMSAETRQKMSDALKGKHRPAFSIEWKQKISANSAWKGKLAHNKGKHRHIENGHYVYTD